MTKTDEDEMQEYQCLLLEGYDEAEARRLARAANDKINSRRLSGPTTGDTRNGHGVRPLISDMTYSYFWENVVSLGVDERSPDERLDDWERADRAVSCGPRRLRQILPARQAETLILLYGMEDGIARSYQEVAEEMGVKKTAVESSRQKAMLNLRTHYGVLTDEDIARKEREKARRLAYYKRTGA